MRLRAIQRRDLETARAWVNDPRVAEGLDRVLPVSDADQDAWFEKLLVDADQVVFAVEERATRRYVGNVGLRRMEPRHRKAEFWGYIGNPDDWGKGFGSDATRAVVRFGFDQLNLHRIYLYVLASNDRAMRAYEAAGFSREGVAREDAFVAGKWVDTVRMGLLSRECPR